MDKKITIVTMFVTIILTLALLVGGIFLSRHLTAQAENNNIQEELPHEHDMTEWKIVLTPTCTEAGQEQRVCSTCGETETREIVLTGHNFATISEEGNECIGVTRHLKCEICGEEETMSSLGIGHTFDQINIGGSDVERIPATCTSPAFNKATCSRCGEVQLTIVEGSSALGHTFSEWVVITPATCTEKGIEEHRCTCGYSNGETREIPALTHDWTYDFDESRQPSPPICGETWEKPYICTRCGELKTEICGPLEHQYSDGQCVRCGEYEYSWPDLDKLKFISVETSKFMLFSRQNDSADGRPVYTVIIWETTIDEENKTYKNGNISCTIQITGKNAPNELRADFDVDRSDLFPEMYWINGTINIPENPQYEGTYIEYNSWKEN